MLQINDLFNYENLKIVQNDEWFKFSLDSVLLAEYVKIEAGDTNIIDLCSGNLPIPFILSTKYDRTYHAIELQKEIYDCGIKSMELNNLEDKINFINDDVKNIFNHVEKETFDIVTCNPPYFKNSLKNSNTIKSVARHEIKITLEDIISVSSKLLKDNKKFYLSHLPERLDEIILLCTKYHLNVKEIVMINNSNLEPVLVLIKAVKNAKHGLKIRYLNNVDKIKDYKNIFEGDIL